MKKSPASRNLYMQLGSHQYTDDDDEPSVEFEAMATTPRRCSSVPASNKPVPIRSPKPFIFEHFKTSGKSGPSRHARGPSRTNTMEGLKFKVTLKSQQKMSGASNPGGSKGPSRFARGPMHNSRKPNSDAKADPKDMYLNGTYVSRRISLRLKLNLQDLTCWEDFESELLALRHLEMTRDSRPDIKADQTLALLRTYSAGQLPFRSFKQKLEATPFVVLFHKKAFLQSQYVRSTEAHASSLDIFQPPVSFKVYFSRVGLHLATSRIWVTFKFLTKPITEVFQERGKVRDALLSLHRITAKDILNYFETPPKI